MPLTEHELYQRALSLRSFPPELTKTVDGAWILGRWGELATGQILRHAKFTYTALCEMRGPPMATAPDDKLILLDFDVVELGLLDAKAKMHFVLWRKTQEARIGIDGWCPKVG